MAWLHCQHPATRTAQNVELRKVLTTIGRAPGTDVTLNDAVVRPTHANIMRKGSTFSVSLVDRAGELRVNGKRVRTTHLADGDVITLGGWECTFSLEAPKAADGGGGEQVTLDLLERLVDLSAKLMRDTEPRALFTNLLKALVEMTGAEKGFLLVFRDGQRQMAASHNVDGDADARVSDSIINQVVEHLQPIIVSDAMNDARFGRARSVVDLRLSSVMCVPLIYRNDLLGVIYVGNDSITDLFTDRDLSLLKVYASQAAVVLHHAVLLNQLKLDNRNLRTQLENAGQGRMIGSHPNMKALFKVLRRVAPTDLSVLVLGETGTGKEMVARELHSLSDRKSGPFIAINCGAIPENLLESELFGHKKGAFTGAISDKIGKVEAANGGTLFLDEIGEMPMNLQVKLLRVLQERTIERVGDLTPRPVDIRVVSATNKSLDELIKEGDFREDLYYRLNEISVNLPPLRERGEDIEMLAQYFLNKYAEQYEAKARGFTNQGLLGLKGYYWPGNVRQLENRIKKAVIMSDRALLSPDDLGLSKNDKRHVRPMTEAVEDFKLEYTKEVLELNNWNKAQTARDLGVDARTIFRYIEKLTD